LGPSRDELQAKLFEAIQRAGAERLTPEQVEALEKQRKQQAKGGDSDGGGIGFRLGGHGTTSEPIGTSSSSAREVNPGRQQQLVSNSKLDFNSNDLSDYFHTSNYFEFIASILLLSIAYPI
jgi:hypothetical protein